MLRMLAGFELGTTITSVFRVKTTGFEHRPDWKSWIGRVMLAEANTSAGAPCWICAASAFEPPKEYFSVLSIVGKTFVSEEAAKTVSCARARVADDARPAGSASRHTAATTHRKARRRRRTDTIEPLSASSGRSRWST